VAGEAVASPAKFSASPIFYIIPTNRGEGDCSLDLLSEGITPPLAKKT